MYQAAAAMNANARWQEAIADNLASASIPGFKKQDVSFDAIQSGMMSQATPEAQRQFLLPRASSTVNYSQGQLRPTNVATDMAIEGSGFFQIQMPSGATAFTRDGEFHLSAIGQLVTKQGYPVLGENGPIQIDPALGGSISVAATGEVSQGSEVRGKLKLVDFQKPGALTQINGGFFTNSDPTVLPFDATAASVRAGFLEAANVSPMNEMANLISAMRSFEANQHTMQINNDRLSRTISELGSPN